MKYICSLIVVNDIAISKAFYTGVLGQAIEFDFGENVLFKGGFAIHDKTHYQGLIGRNVSHAKTNEPYNNFELYFETEDIVQVCAGIATKNIQVVHDLREQPWCQRVVRFYDPDGYIVEVGETMTSVVKRLHGRKMTIEEICKATSMPEGFVKMVIQ